MQSHSLSYSVSHNEDWSFGINMDDKIDSFRKSSVGDLASYVEDDFAETNFLLLKFKILALDLGEIKNIVEKSSKPRPGS